MTHVMQTRFGHEGNCLNACLASIFDIPLDMIPEFEDDGRNWRDPLNEWLIDNYQCFIAIIKMDERSLSDVHSFYDSYMIMCGPSERGLHHAVVYKGDTMVHDPHPDHTGLKEVKEAYLLVTHFSALEKE